jgi:integrase
VKDHGNLSEPKRYRVHRPRKPGGRWPLATFHLTPEGKWVEVGQGSYPRKKDAEAKGDAIMSEVRRGVYTSPTDLTLERFTIGEFLVQKRATVAVRTYSCYETWARKYLLPALGSMPLQRLQGSHFTNLYLDLGDRLAPSTLRLGHAINRLILGDAVRIGYLIVSPLDRAIAPRGPRRSEAMRVWSAQEVRSFLAFTANEPDAALWRLFLVLALRRGEALGIVWPGVDFERQTVAITETVIDDPHGRATISRPKTPGSRRVIDGVDPVTCDLLRHHRREQLAERMRLGIRTSSNLVFAYPTGEPLVPSLVSQRFAGLVRRSGLPQIRLHDLRHTAASLMLAAGEPVHVVAQRLGHSSPTITMSTYAHLLPGMSRDAGLRLAALVDESG